MNPSPVPSPSVDDASDHKATLFCQNCDHASPVDGDWRVRTVGSRQRLRCPECRSVVDERRVPGRHREDHDPAAPIQRYVDAWHRYWSAWTNLLADESRAEC